jgi:hypothetical protein
MKNLKILTTIVFILSLFIVLAAAQTNKKKRPKKNKAVMTKPVNDAQTDTEDFKILTGALMGNLEEPLIYVARDMATFKLLTTVVPELSEEAEIDFKKYAVVAAFLGTKSTAGFEVGFRKGANGAVKIETLDRPEGAMIAQVLTMPFKVALIPLDDEKALALEIGADWKNAMQIYRVSAGEFGFSGGFAGTQKKFNLKGTVGVMRVGDLITVGFNLSGKDAEKGRKTDEIVSGKADGKNISFTRIDAGNLVEPPHPALSATGTLNSNNFSLVFKSLPTYVADGYTSEGKLSAVK